MGRGAGVDTRGARGEKAGQKVGHPARELATVFSVTFCLLVTVVSPIVKTPPPPPHQWKMTKAARNLVMMK